MPRGGVGGGKVEFDDSIRRQLSLSWPNYIHLGGRGNPQKMPLIQLDESYFHLRRLFTQSSLVIYCWCIFVFLVDFVAFGRDGSTV